MTMDFQWLIITPLSSAISRPSFALGLTWAWVRHTLPSAKKKKNTQKKTPLMDFTAEMTRVPPHVLDHPPNSRPAAKLSANWMDVVQSWSCCDWGSVMKRHLRFMRARIPSFFPRLFHTVWKEKEKLKMMLLICLSGSPRTGSVSYCHLVDFLG